MSMRIRASLIALALLGGCNSAPQPPAKQPKAKAEVPVEAANASEPQPPANSALNQWLIGTWSFEGNCQTDYVVHYNPDGTLDNAGNLGTWSAKGDEVTEVITQRYAEGADKPEKVDPPETLSYTVSRAEQNRGVLTHGRQSIPILRC